MPEIQKANEAGMTPVISNEALCGLVHPRKRYGKDVADRLKKTLPEAKIIISIRKQNDSILSHYRQYIADGHRGTIKDYLVGNHLPSGFHPDCQLDHFEYDLFISYYMQLFGKNSVLVILQEELLKDSQRVCDEMAVFLGMKKFSAPQDEKARVGLKGLSLLYRRFFNQFYLGIPDWSKPKQTLVYTLISRMGEIINKYSPKSLDKKIEKKLVESINSIVGDYYKSSNSKLKQLSKIDIDKFNYDI